MKLFSTQHYIVSLSVMTSIFSSYLHFQGLSFCDLYPTPYVNEIQQNVFSNPLSKSHFVGHYLLLIQLKKERKSADFDLVFTCIHLLTSIHLLTYVYLHPPK